MFSAGNDEGYSDDSNSGTTCSNIHTICIGSVSSEGTPAYYTEPGACNLASTYGGDLHDNDIGIVSSFYWSFMNRYPIRKTTFEFLYQADLHFANLSLTQEIEIYGCVIEEYTDMYTLSNCMIVQHCLACRQRELLLFSKLSEPWSKKV